MKLTMWCFVIVLNQCTRSLEKNGLLHLCYIATILCRKDEADYFFSKLPVLIKDNNNSPHGKLHRFLFPFLFPYLLML